MEERSGILSALSSTGRPEAIGFVAKSEPCPLISHFSEAWKARLERNPGRARTIVRNRAGFLRERSLAALVDVSFGANSSEDRLYFSPYSQSILHLLLNSVCAKAVKNAG